MGGSDSDYTDNEEINGAANKSTPRAPTLSQQERSILYSLVSKYKLVVESKHHTAQWVAKKQATWNTIQNEFLARPGTSNRTAKQLKKCYENYKRISRNKKKELSKDETISSSSQKSRDSIRAANKDPLRVSVRSIEKLKSSGPGNSEGDHRDKAVTARKSDASAMESELHSKKIKLMNLQLEHEEMKIRFLQEEHELKMSLLHKQYGKICESLIANDDLDIKSDILQV